MPTSVPNFNFLAALVSKIRRGFPNKKMGAADLFKRPLTDIFLYRAPVLKNAYEFARFSLPNWITFGDTEGVL